MVSANRVRLFFKTAVDEPLLRHQERAIEWFSAMAMIAWALVLALPGDTFTQVSYSEFLSHSFTEEQFAALFACIGGMRIVALFINGAWPRSPVIRMIGASCGVIMWGNVGLLFYESGWVDRHTATTGPALYLLLAMFEVLSIYRASFDARYHKR